MHNNKIQENAMNESIIATYPLLGQILTILNLPLQPLYSARDLALIFRVSLRAIQHRIEAGRLTPRDLPGRAKFLPQDIEDFLAASRKRTENHREVDLLDRRMASR
jgi:hypothetical protein